MKTANTFRLFSLLALVILVLAQLACEKVTPTPAPVPTVTATTETPVPTLPTAAPVLAQETAPVAYCVSPDVVGLWLRVSPSAAAAPIVALPANTPLVVEQVVKFDEPPSEWAQVTVTDEYGQTVTGYVNKDYVGVCR